MKTFQAKGVGKRWMPNVPTSFFVGDDVMIALRNQVSFEGGPKDLLNPMAIPYPSGNQRKHKWGEMFAEAKCERDAVRRKDKHNANLFDLIRTKHNFLENKRNKRPPEIAVMLPTCLCLSFLKEMENWPEDVKTEYMRSLHRRR